MAENGSVPETLLAGSVLLVAALHLLLVRLVLARVWELHILKHEPCHWVFQPIGLVHLLLYLLAELGQLCDAVLRTLNLLGAGLTKTYLGSLTGTCQR